MTWRTADPYDRSTWPEAGSEVIVVISRDGYRDRKDVGKVYLDEDYLYVGHDGMPWGSANHEYGDEPCTLKWIPWEVIRDLS